MKLHFVTTKSQPLTAKGFSYSTKQTLTLLRQKEIGH